MKNGDETDVDCGGLKCGKCGAWQLCGGAGDCASNSCVTGVCADPDLVGWWRFEENQGNQVRDSSGSGNHLNATGGTAWTAGYSGSALGVTNQNYVSGPSAPQLANLKAFTVELWIRVTALPAQGVSDLLFASEEPSFAVVLRDDGSLTANLNGPLGARTPPLSLLGRWVHVAVVWDGVAGTCSIAIDGEVKDSRAAVKAPLANVAKGLFLLNYPNNVAGKFTLDDVRLYRVAHTPAQVLDHATLFARYRFDEGQGGTTADATGHGFTVVLRGTADWAAGVNGQGKALLLDGSGKGSGLSESGKPERLTAVGDFTIAARFNLKGASTSGGHAIIGTWPNAVGAILLFREANGKLTLAHHVDWSGPPFTEFEVPVQAPLNTWHHTALVREGQTLRAYFNGKKMATTFTAGSSAPSAEPIQPSEWQLGLANGSYFMNGAIDDLRFYTRALRDSEILAQLDE